jgi:flagellar biosynthesis/type III secretory pathway protein FliH
MATAQIITIIIGAIGIILTIGGLVFGLARLLTNSASRVDLEARFTALTEKIDAKAREAQAKIEEKARESTQSHAAFLTRAEFDRMEKDRERRLDELHKQVEKAVAATEKAVSSLNGHYQSILQSITNLAVVITKKGRSDE